MDVAHMWSPLNCMFRRFGRLNIHLHMYLMQCEVEVATKRLFELFWAFLEPSWADLGVVLGSKMRPNIGPTSAKTAQNGVLEPSS